MTGDLQRAIEGLVAALDAPTRWDDYHHETLIRIRPACDRLTVRDQSGHDSEVNQRTGGAR